MTDNGIIPSTHEGGIFVQGQRAAGLMSLFEPVMIVIRAVIFDTRCNRANATLVGHALRPGQPVHHV